MTSPATAGPVPFYDLIRPSQIDIRNLQCLETYSSAGCFPVQFRLHYCSSTVVCSKQVYALQISPRKVRIGFQLNVCADLRAGQLAAFDALLEQFLRRCHLAILELHFGHLVVQLLLHCLHAPPKSKRISNTKTKGFKKGV